ncbi:ABC transporter ATP-binding protein [Streptomyces sp. CAU 1734]|uniref:ABC transporter ATP-binding protein n=1 Tax=Streptomyces sp. CAU 1734 TaxID=3140360 RepID=UPI00326085FE
MAEQDATPAKAGAGAAREAPAERGGWARRLTGYAWRYRRNSLLALGSSLVGMGVLALIPLITKVVIDDVIGTRTRSLAVWTGVLIAAAVVVYLLTYIRRYYGGRLALDVQHDLRTEMFATITRLDGRRQDELSTGQVVGRATSDLQLIQSLLFMLPMTVGNFLLFLISLVVMAWLSLPLTLIALAVAPAVWWIARRSRTRLHPATWYAQSRAAAVAGVVDGAVSGVRVVKGFGQEEQEAAKLREAGRQLFAGRLRTIKLNSRYTPALQSVPAIGQVAMLAVGGWLATRQQISLGTFVAFSAYLAQLVGPVRMLAMVLTVGQQARAGVDRVLQLIDTEPTMKDGTRELPADAPATVEFDSVTFGYDPARPVLDGFSLEIGEGETVAVVGASGSGKSTVSLLLPRFYDVDAGAVLVGGHDVRELTTDSLRAAIGLVPEDSFLFSDTIRANIAYGKPGASDEEITTAARAAQADRFIAELPHGYDTKVGEHGLTLSGGQRQRVALARAILTDPRLLLLDDATSAIDARVEHEIHEALRTVMAGRTTLLIAHRRSTLNLADRIAVLDGGRLADIGTHDELTARSPLYRKLLTDPEELGAVSPGHATALEAAGPPADDARTVRAELDAEFDAEQGITPRLWAREESAAGGKNPGAAAPDATPELLALVAALPPADDTPQIDEARAVRPVPAPSPAGKDRRNRGLRLLLGGFGAPLLISLLLVTVDAGMGLLLPVLIRYGIDQGVEQAALAAVWAASAVALVTVLVQWAAQTGEIRKTGRTGERVLYSVRLRIFAQLQRLGLDYYERELTGRIMTRMTTDVDALSTFLQTGLVTAFVSLVTFSGIMVALIVIDLHLALVVFATLPVLIIGTYYFRRQSVKAYELARDRVSVVNSDLQESVSGLRIVQAFRREGDANHRYVTGSDSYRSARVRGQWLISVYFPFVQLLSSVAAAAVMIVGAGRIDAGTLTTGALVAYLLYIELFFAPVQQLSQVFDGYQQAAVSLKRIQQLLEEPTSTAAAERPAAVRELSGEIAFEGVDFAYGDEGGAALSGVRLRIPAGQTVAFVGETGAGKSTLVKLVARFYDPTRGRVTVDGRDLRELDMTEYRHRLGVVPQEAYLFEGTVRDAIAYGRPGAGDAEVEAAARAVGAHDMIATLDGGYLHAVSERGRNLSAGQRQLIALARAELVDPDILLLDEATAALDLATEAQVNQATDRLTGRRTTLVVAHRLTTAARADRVVVMAGGRVAEDGTHDELLARDGRYATLWRTFIGEDEPAVRVVS